MANVLQVDDARCEGHGKCYRVAPDHFRPIDDHGHAGAVGGPVDPLDTAAVAKGDFAIKACPEEALSWQTV
jgi:ferredoxin